jgi:hypothetical protein
MASTKRKRIMTKAREKAARSVPLGPFEHGYIDAGDLAGREHMGPKHRAQLFYPHDPVKRTSYTDGWLTWTNERNVNPRRKSVKKKTRKKNPGWYIHVQRGKGPVMLWNGKSFNNRPETRPIPFSSAGSAKQKARWLLGKYFHQLSNYKIWVSEQFFGTMQEPRRVNPESLDEATQKLENFTGTSATRVERTAPRSTQKTGWALGELDLIGYRAARKGIEGGRKVRYSHKFRNGSRPLLATSTDGKQLKIVGGRYEVTEAGIEDR